MTINADTRLSRIIRHNEKALDAIISISPAFAKLKNPLLRTLMAPRTTIGMAARIGNCSPADFFERLAPLGFDADTNTRPEARSAESEITPGTISCTLDVREKIRKGEDPLQQIMKAVKQVKTGKALLLINSFEPLPLIALLNEKGFTSYVEKKAADLVYTTFTRKQDTVIIEEPPPVADDWDTVFSTGKEVRYIDVRGLPMPQPMVQILEQLNALPPGVVLYVYHSRIPVYLLAELKQGGWKYRIKQIDASEVHVMIFKDEERHQ